MSFQRGLSWRDNHVINSNCLDTNIRSWSSGWYLLRGADLLGRRLRESVTTIEQNPTKCWWANLGAVDLDIEVIYASSPSTKLTYSSQVMDALYKLMQKNCPPVRISRCKLTSPCIADLQRRKSRNIYKLISLNLQGFFYRTCIVDILRAPRFT